MLHGSNSSGQVEPERRKLQRTLSCIRENGLFGIYLRVVSRSYLRSKRKVFLVERRAYTSHATRNPIGVMMRNRPPGRESRHICIGTDVGCSTASRSGTCSVNLSLGNPRRGLISCVFDAPKALPCLSLACARTYRHVPGAANEVSKPVLDARPRLLNCRPSSFEPKNSHEATSVAPFQLTKQSKETPALLLIDRNAFRSGGRVGIPLKIDLNTR